jgi:protein TonB
MKTSFKPSWRELERKRPFFFRIGMTVSLLITFFAFEWQTPVSRTEILQPEEWELEEEIMIPRTVSRQVEMPQPELTRTVKPDYTHSNPVIVPDIQPVNPTPADTFTIINIDPVPEPEPEPDPKPMLLPEVMPAFPGGEKALMDFLRSNTRFPAEARKAGVDGVVYITFVIDENGNVTEAKCERSPGAVLTAEAMRVLALMPKWSPGKQGGKRVSVIMTLPFNFRLTN